MTFKCRSKRMTGSGSFNLAPAITTFGLLFGCCVCSLRLMSQLRPHVIVFARGMFAHKQRRESQGLIRWVGRKLGHIEQSQMVKRHSNFASSTPTAYNSTYHTACFCPCLVMLAICYVHRTLKNLFRKKAPPVLSLKRASLSRDLRHL